MKAEIHPTYYPQATITCACGEVYTIGSTKEKINVEICSACHPFYTGTEKSLDVAGMVDKFKSRASKAKASPKKKVPSTEK